MVGYPQRDTIFEFDYFISLVRSVGCFLLVFYLSEFYSLQQPAGLDLLPFFPCFSVYLPISSFTVGIFKSMPISSFLTYQRAFTIVLSIFDCSDSSLFMWLLSPIVAFRTSKLVLLSFCIFLIYFLC